MTKKHLIISQTSQASLLSPRLLLKGLTVADAEALFLYRSLPEVTRFQGWAPANVEEAIRFIEQDICTSMDQPDTWFQFGIFLREESILIGDLGIHFLADDGATDTGKTEAIVALGGEVEIGITVAPEFQGRGFASEAVGCVLAFLFDTLQKSKVVASVDPENKKSMALMAGNGFHLEGIYNNSVSFRGELVDDAVFEMTNEQWQNQSIPNL